MSGNIIQLNEDLIKANLNELVRDTVEETLNALLDHETDELVKAQKYERSESRQGYRSGQTLRPSPAMSAFMSRNSRDSASRLPSSSATNAVKPRSRKPSLRCILPVFPCAALRTSRRLCGEQRCLPARSAT